MTTNATEATVEQVISALSAGSVLITHEAFRALPPGTIIRSKHRDEHPSIRRTKGQDGEWPITTPGNSGHIGLTAQNHAESLALDWWEVESIPIPVGTPITMRAQLESLAVNSVLRCGTRDQHADTYNLVKGEDGNFYEPTDTARSVPYRPYIMDLTGYNVVTWNGPEFQNPLPPSESNAPVEVTETFRQYKQRFRTVAVGFAHTYSGDVNMSTVQAGLTQLGVADEDITPGMSLWVWDITLINQLPQRTIVTRGTDPTSADFSVWGLSEYGNFVWLLGDRNWEGLMTIRSIPDMERAAWVDEAGAESDAQRIEEFKALAWANGWKAKVEEEWCGRYEHAMSILGVDPETYATDDQDYES